MIVSILILFPCIRQIPGTRTSNSTPTCASPIECPETNCNDIMACAHGQELDRRGCPTCECRDPCAEAKCKPDESCELVPLDCEVRLILDLTS